MQLHSWKTCCLRLVFVYARDSTYMGAYATTQPCQYAQHAHVPQTNKRMYWSRRCDITCQQASEHEVQDIAKNSTARPLKRCRMKHWIRVPKPQSATKPQSEALCELARIYVIPALPLHPKTVNLQQKDAPVDAHTQHPLSAAVNAADDTSTLAVS